MKHLTALNRKARRLEALVDATQGSARAMTDPWPPPTEYPFGCTTVFAPGWEVDSSGGTDGLCQPIERDLYDCYHSCYWPVQVPDALTSNPDWAMACGAPMNDWKSIDLVFP
jgi:hypothetical protein